MSWKTQFKKFNSHSQGDPMTAIAYACATSAQNKPTMLTVQQLCHRLGISETSERRYRKKVLNWPQPVPIGGRLFYPLAVIEPWERELINSSNPAQNGQ